MTRKTIPLVLVIWCCSTMLTWSAAPAASAGPVVERGAAFYVSEIQADASEILSVEEIRGVLAKYEGRTVDFAQLEAAVVELNELYTRKNYLTARAVLPPQTIERGVVKVRLVEGHVGAVSVAGNYFTADSFILDRVALQPGQLVRLDSIEAAINDFNAVNDVKLLAELKPGQAFGTTDVVLKVEEPAREQMALFVDSGGRAESGLLRSGLTVTLNSLTGRRDLLTLSRLESEGSSAKTFAFELPFDRKGTRFRMGYDVSDLKVIAGDYKTLDISGDSADLYASVTSPLVVTPALKVSRLAEVHAKESGSYIAESLNYTTTDVKSVGFGLSAQATASRSAWQGEVNLAGGTAESIDYRDLKTVREFLRGSANFTWERLLKERYPFTFRLAAQWGNKMLPSTEQFSLGGMSTVRGYPEGVLTGDKGYLVSMEQAIPLVGQVKGFIFVDHGGAFPFKGNDVPVSPDDYLTSAGVGLTGNVTDRFSAKLVYGAAVGPATEEAIHFFIQGLF